MKVQIMAFVAGALVLGQTGASAQSVETTSLVDQSRSTIVAGPGTAQSPGTVGAMNAVASGVATSADEVRRQQEGRSMASGADRVAGGGGASAAIGQSPGTVGAMPGN